MAGITYIEDYTEWVTTNYSKLLRMVYGVIATSGYYGRIMTAKDFLHDWLIERSKHARESYDSKRGAFDWYVWMDMKEWYNRDFFRWERYPWVTDFYRGTTCDPRSIEANGPGPDRYDEEIEIMHDIENYMKLIRYTPVRTSDRPEYRIKILQEMLRDEPLTLRGKTIGNPKAKNRAVAKNCGISVQTLYFHLIKMRREFHEFRAK